MESHTDEEILDTLGRISEGAPEALKNCHMPAALQDNLVYIRANVSDALKTLAIQL